MKKEISEKEWIDLCSANWRALQFVSIQTRSEILAALESDGRAIQYVKNQTEELCKIAINNNSYSYVFVREKTPELTKLAISKSPSIIQYIDYKDLSLDLIDFAISLDPHVVRYVSEFLTLNQWSKALTNEWGERALAFVPFRYRKENLKETILEIEKCKLKERIKDL